MERETKSTRKPHRRHLRDGERQVRNDLLRVASYFSPLGPNPNPNESVDSIPIKVSKSASVYSCAVITVLIQELLNAAVSNGAANAGEKIEKYGDGYDCNRIVPNDLAKAIRDNEEMKSLILGHYPRLWDV